MTRPSPVPKRTSARLENALTEVSGVPANDTLPPPPEAEESFSFLKYIPSPQEQYEHLYKVFTEAEAYWE